MKQTVSTKILSLKGWSWLAGLFVLAAIIVPVLNRALLPESVFFVPDWVVETLGKYMCFAIVALAIDLIWGYTGILSLGHAFFFALGAYIMGMHLAKYMNDVLHTVPDFMAYMPWKEFPWFWTGFEHFGYGLLMALLIPALIAFVLGYFAFRSRIKGVYFAIITQALTFAMWRLFLVNETGFGGNNGFTNFKGILGFTLASQAETAKLGLMSDVATTKLALYIVTVVVLCLCFLLCRYIVISKLGKVLRAIRDEEARVAFSGYDTFKFKLFVWIVSAMLCALAGILYIPQVGIINPTEMNPAKSIEAVVWVAVGGRGTLIGAILGAGVVNGTKTLFTTGALADYWLFILGGLAVIVPLFFPGGLVDKKSHVKIAQYIGRMLGARNISYSFSNLIPVLVLVFYFGLLGLLISFFADNLHGGAYRQLSIYALMALPLYIGLNAFYQIFRHKKFNFLKSIIEQIWQVLWYFVTRQAAVSLMFGLLLVLAFQLAIESEKSFSVFVLLLLFLSPVLLVSFKLFNSSRVVRTVFMSVYVLLALLFAFKPVWLPFIATYLGIMLLLALMLMPFMPFLRKVIFRPTILNLLVLALVLLLYAFLFLFAGQYFPVNSPLSIFMQITHSFFGFNETVLLNSGLKPNLYFALCASYMGYCLIRQSKQPRNTGKFKVSE